MEPGEKPRRPEKLPSMGGQLFGPARFFNMNRNYLFIFTLVVWTAPDISMSFFISSFIGSCLWSFR